MLGYLGDERVSAPPRAGFWSRLFGRKAASIDSTTSSNPAMDIVAGIARTGRPPLRGTLELLQAYSTMPRLRGLVDRIATTVSATPWNANRIRGRKTRSRIAREVRSAKSVDRKKIMRALADTGELEQLEHHPALDLLSNPNPMLTSAQIWQISQIHLELVGETFQIIERGSSSGLPRELWPMPAHWVRQLPRPGDDRFHVTGGGFAAKWVPAKDMLWIRYADPLNPYARGTGIGRSLANELDADEYAAQTTAARFFNGAIPDMLVMLQGPNNDETRRLKEQWIEQHKGHLRSGSIHFTNAENMKAEKLTPSMVDLDMVALRNFEASIIQETFGVPPEMVGRLEHSNRATIDAADLIMALYVIVPRLDFHADFLNTFLVPQFDETTVLSYESPVPDDWDFALKAATARPETLSIDEWRALQGHEPMADDTVGRKHLFGAGLAAIDLSEGEMPGSSTQPVEPGDGDSETNPVIDPVIHPTAPESTPLIGGSGGGSKSPLLVLVDRSLIKQDDPRVHTVLNQLDEDDLLESVNDLWLDELKVWMGRELTTLGANTDIRVVEALAVRHLQSFGANRVTDLINETTRQQLRDTLAEGLASGDNRLEMTERVKEVFGEATDWRAENIARTETLRSSNWAITQGMKLAGVTSRDWLGINDGKEREAHVAMNGQSRAIDHPFTAPGGFSAMFPGDFGDPSLDCQCFVGETPIASPSDILRVYRREYSGELVEVASEDGHSFTGTPNHPVLTARGWIPLRDLNESDHLVRTTSADVFGSIGHHEQDGHASFEEIYDLATLSRSTLRMAAGAHENFHGDGFESEVNVVTVHGHLGDRAQPASLKHLAHLPLAGPSFLKRELASGSEAHALRLGRGTTTDRIMRGLREARTLIGSETTHPNDIGLGAAADLDSGLQKSSAYAGSRDPETLAQRELAFASDVGRDQSLSIDIGAKTVMPALGFVRVARVRRFSSSCQVFNLQSASSWYLANGFVSHNCRCTVVASRSDGTDEEKAAHRLGVWKSFDHHLSSWETKAKRAFIDGFRKQESAIIRALDHVFGRAA